MDVRGWCALFFLKMTYKRKYRKIASCSATGHTVHVLYPDVRHWMSGLDITASTHTPTPYRLPNPPRLPSHPHGHHQLEAGRLSRHRAPCTHASAVRHSVVAASLTDRVCPGLWALRMLSKYPDKRSSTSVYL